ncbi:2-oxoglutarate dehydrogenase, partial [Burkholderia pseudomallei]|nr:2-oxoglutarate dehydrogenase [Burkholderia pseudomallei]MBF3542890.1 2-oxoglutarate dehydrogenase [Burkholderia pseudomallei]MBF3605050.1 2-oxoglutarate dehydrogenase [Burkholderia pseudomallei]MBF3605051.1 2-oxoglutarate dehydrogenase [Burkholderia pseudomallei]
EGWRVVYLGTVDIEHTLGARTEHKFSFERST